MRGETKKQIERIGKYMIRPLLSLFLTDRVVVDRIIKHLQLSFIAQRPPPPREIHQNMELEVSPADIS